MNIGTETQLKNIQDANFPRQLESAQGNPILIERIRGQIQTTLLCLGTCLSIETGGNRELIDATMRELNALLSEVDSEMVE